MALVWRSMLLFISLLCLAFRFHLAQVFIDFVWILGSPWDPFWSRFSDFFVNWVTKWTALVPGLIF